MPGACAVASSSLPASSVATAWAAFIAAEDFPCLGAKAALERGGIEMMEAGELTAARDDRAIVAALQRFARHADAEPLFVSFAVVFAAAGRLTEKNFEQALWQRLQALHEIDRRQFGWDPSVSSDPHSPRFSMSIGGHAFYVVGLHPSSSRRARRFRQPVLVFNLHSQFERLRTDGRYEKLRQSIIRRDIAYAGSANPMLAVHGESSEARQYSGRRVDAEWRCPFHAQNGEPPA